MVNEIDGYKAPTQPQSSTPSSLLDGEGDCPLRRRKVPFSFQSDSPPTKLEGVCSSQGASAVSFQSRSPSSKLEGVGTTVALTFERKQNRDEPKFASIATFPQPRLILSSFAANLVVGVSFQCSVFSTEKTRAAFQTGLRPCPRTMRWPNGDGGRCSCTSPNSPRRRSPRRSARAAPSFPAICNRPATYAAAGIPPILEVARFTQTAIRKRGQAPYTLYEVEARYTTSGSQSPFQVSHCVPRMRPHPGTKEGSTTRWSMDTAPN